MIGNTVHTGDDALLVPRGGVDVGQLGSSVRAGSPMACSDRQVNNDGETDNEIENFQVPRGGQTLNAERFVKTDNS